MVVSIILVLAGASGLSNTAGVGRSIIVPAVLCRAIATRGAAAAAVCSSAIISADFTTERTFAAIGLAIIILPRFWIGTGSPTGGTAYFVTRNAVLAGAAGTCRCC